MASDNMKIFFFRTNSWLADWMTGWLAFIGLWRREKWIKQIKKILKKNAPYSRKPDEGPMFTVFIDLCFSCTVHNVNSLCNVSRRNLINSLFKGPLKVNELRGFPVLCKKGQLKSHFRPDLGNFIATIYPWLWHQIAH